jgi:hypothetical protein
MSRKSKMRFSPASPIALIALFVALGGVSYAAGTTIGTSDLQNGAVTKKKLHRNAVGTGKIRTAAVSGEKIADEAVTGAKVNESTLGIVPDAANLAGKQPQAFESKGFGGGGGVTTVGLPSNATTEVKSLALPAGTYLVIARGGLNNNGLEVGAGQTCTVAAGSVSQTVGFGALGANSKAGDREEFDTFVIATLDSPGNASLTCHTTSGWEIGNVTNATLAAVSLQP